MQTITIPRRFRGPPNSGNGGYVCGILARQIAGAAEVTLRAPPPLETELDLVEVGARVWELRQGTATIAVGRPVTFDLSRLQIQGTKTRERPASVNRRGTKKPPMVRSPVDRRQRMGEVSTHEKGRQLRRPYACRSTITFSISLASCLKWAARRW